MPVPDQVAPAPDANVRGMISYKAAAAQNVIRMQGDTVLAIDKLMIANTGVDAVSDTELDLRQGTIFGSVKKLSAASTIPDQNAQRHRRHSRHDFHLERQRRRSR